MGQVWAARQTGRLGLPKLVAIKTAIPMDSKDCRQVQEYLFDEAQVASSVDHPNVCKILELGQERDVLFIAMEWLNGVPLSTLVSKVPERRLPYRMAAYLVAQACSGLHAAHELTDDDGVHLEVVHRDATPHNLMITSTGEVKVTDFGIVKSRNQQHQATQVGELKGKLAYLAPEQIRGRAVDRRADIFTLGCVLYFVTVGQGAFNPEIGQDAGQTISRILEGAYLSPSSVLSDYPPELEAIVQRALERDPEQRFQTADEMRIALDAFLADGTRAVSREDVAALLQDFCGDAIEQRRAQIRSAQRLFDSQSAPLRSGSYPTIGSANDVARPLAQSCCSSAEIPADWSRISPLTAAPERGRAKLLWIGMASAVLVCGIVGAFALGRSANENPQPATANVSNPIAPGVPPMTANTQQLQDRMKGSPPESVTKTESTSESSPRIVATRGSFKASLPHTVKPIQPAVDTSAPAAQAAPSPSNQNTQFTQSLSRKPPRHTIDESDPFEK